MKYSKKRGLAAIPIILILLSIGIIIGVFFYIFDPLQSFFLDRDLQRKEDLEKISRALSFYYRDFGKYPDFKDGEFIVVHRGETYAWGEPFKPYMDILPSDPSLLKKYAYWVDRSNNLQSYRLYASLDRPEDEKQSCTDISGCLGVPMQNMCGMYSVCNYGITSGNISP